MSYDPAYSEPSDWDNELVSDTKLNQMKDNTQHNYKYGIKVCEDFSGDVPILARGAKTVDIDGTTTYCDVTFTFASDCDDGDPGFTTTPTVLGLSQQRSGTAAMCPVITALSTTAMTVRYYYQGFSNPSGSPYNVIFHFAVLGD